MLKISKIFLKFRVFYFKDLCKILIGPMNNIVVY